MRREIALLLALKFAALALLWLLFFSPAHRTHVDRDATREHFAVAGAPGKASEYPAQLPVEESAR